MAAERFEAAEYGSAEALSRIDEARRANLLPLGVGQAEPTGPASAAGSVDALAKMDEANNIANEQKGLLMQIRDKIGGGAGLIPAGF